MESVNAFCQDTRTIFEDDTSHFRGDIVTGLSKKSDNTYIMSLKTNDTTILYKQYYLADTIYKMWNTFETNLDGEINGFYYAIDTVNLSWTKNFYLKGELISNVSVLGADTISFAQLINDTLIYVYTMEDGYKTEWQMNPDFVKNGFYKKYNLKTDKLVETGNYRAIRETDIKNMDRYNELLK